MYLFFFKTPLVKFRIFEKVSSKFLDTSAKNKKMSNAEGGTLFLQHFAKACVEEAKRQEGLERYKQRVAKLKRLPDYSDSNTSVSLSCLF